MIDTLAERKQSLLEIVSRCHKTDAAAVAFTEYRLDRLVGRSLPFIR
jgi:hypothetical protein